MNFSNLPGRHTEVETNAHYQARPQDKKLKRALVIADRFALHGYSFLKHYKLINDRLISRILQRLS